MIDGPESVLPTGRGDINKQEASKGYEVLNEPLKSVPAQPLVDTTILTTSRSSQRQERLLQLLSRAGWAHTR